MTPFITKSREDPPARSGISDTKRRIAWGVITQSIEPQLRAKIRVHRGEVEELLRGIRHQYFKHSASTRALLKDKLREAKQDKHDDTSTYIMFVYQTAMRLGTLGHTLTDEDIAYHLYKGLPSDYDMIVQAMKLPRPTPLTLDEIKTLLEDFATNPRIPGSTNPLRTDKTYTFDDRPRGKPICKQHQMGKCSFGKRCRYKHVDAPEDRHNERRNNERRNNERSDRQQERCEFCQRFGHGQTDCRAKKAWMDKTMTIDDSQPANSETRSTDDTDKTTLDWVFSINDLDIGSSLTPGEEEADDEVRSTTYPTSKACNHTNVNHESEGRGVYGQMDGRWGLDVPYSG